MLLMKGTFRGSWVGALTFDLWDFVGLRGVWTQPKKKQFMSSFCRAGCSSFAKLEIRSAELFEPCRDRTLKKVFNQLYQC